MDLERAVFRGSDLSGPSSVDPGPNRTRPGWNRTVVQVEFERIEALHVLALATSHLNVAERRGDMSPQVPLVMSIRDKLSQALEEDR